MTSFVSHMTGSRSSDEGKQEQKELFWQGGEHKDGQPIHVLCVQHLCAHKPNAGHQSAHLPLPCE